MQLHWAGRTLLTSPADIGAKHPGPELQDAVIVLAEPMESCTQLTNTNAEGKIVLMQRSGPNGCSFTTKAWNAQNAGAVAAIIYNNDRPFLDRLAEKDSRITIPTVFIGTDDGTQLAAAINAGTTTISVQGMLAFTQVAMHSSTITHTFVYGLSSSTF